MGQQTRMSSNRAQNAIEYILLVVAVLLVFLLFLNPQGPFKPAMEKTFFNATVGQLQKVSDEIRFKTAP